ncbi:fungal specific transcription factor domain-containing protein [Aspergillus affinis]|uniref:fungal specific transcription factor domain-containing protein n=1 Tax=Aspergillus affinis TaxID=1070780 RepID=UPI0022FEB1BD|nr:uncharacterized protein KD926_004566 [Aspergillus affinis]KAI9043063.1 hypothetical protein KD926_004566 [Aspergillus affinis]
MAASLEAFHPSMTHSQILWKAYQENVAPVMMIFHQPTLLKLIYKAASNKSYIDHASEAVVFAVYFTAVNSMGTEECAEKLAQDQSSLHEYYKFATQQALARAGFLQTRSLAVLQAAVLFFTCLRGPGHAYFRTGTEQISSLEITSDDPKRAQLFLTAIEVVEFAHLLETNSRTSKWSWLFEGYPQWQAAAVVLMELCARPQTAETQGAWVVVEKAVTSWVGKYFQEGSITMQTVSCLMERAAAVHGHIRR